MAKQQLFLNFLDNNTKNDGLFNYFLINFSKQLKRCTFNYQYEVVFEITNCRAPYMQV
jgi:hypothetical protein